MDKSGETHINAIISVIDHKILRAITGAHPKTPNEMLYLETGELDIPNVIRVRRLLYWQNIVSRHENELLRKIYEAMKESPLKGDWINMVKEDLNKIGMELKHEEQVKQMTRKEFKDIVKDKVKKLALEEFNNQKSNHKKVKGIEHKSLNEPQEYLTSNKIMQKTSCLLFNLRTKCQKEFKENFPKQNGGSMCPLCNENQDTQEHALACKVVAQKLGRNVTEVKYAYLFGDLEEQIKVCKVYRDILKLRTSLLAPRGTQDGPTGAIIPDPATSYV